MDDGDKEAIEELVLTAMNKALIHADGVNEMEMASAALPTSVLRVPMS